MVKFPLCFSIKKCKYISEMNYPFKKMYNLKFLCATPTTLFLFSLLSNFPTLQIHPMGQIRPSGGCFWLADQTFDTAALQGAAVLDRMGQWICHRG